MLRQILGEDYRLQFATDGRKALQLAQQQKPDLILLDIMMPELNGYDVCRQLKADPRTESIPVIFVSALAEVGDEADGFAAGAVDYIIKPVRAPVVRARVRTHLSLVDIEALRQSRLQIVQRLGRAAEYKDNETGMHVLRMSITAMHWHWRWVAPLSGQMICCTRLPCMTWARSAYLMPCCSSPVRWMMRCGRSCASIL